MFLDICIHKKLSAMYSPLRGQVYLRAACRRRQISAVGRFVIILVVAALVSSSAAGAAGTSAGGAATLLVRETQEVARDRSLAQPTRQQLEDGSSERPLLRRRDH